MTDERRFELPDGLAPDEERAVLRALERYLLQENPHPEPWVLAARVEATGQGALQTRRYADAPWRGPQWAPFARRGGPPFTGRGDAH